ncbi:MAG: flagellar type III secretion system pore protein FliP [Verrucomicrobiota bacterium]|nr:flagellar type III secretion system pore protein FliP [Verrucomicrobiota bacterium]MDG1891502.1 flagellar type III secretion system pore protein FliP [Verrucomicrobiota bacterium]
MHPPELRFPMIRWLWPLVSWLMLTTMCPSTLAQATDGTGGALPFSFNLGFNPSGDPANVDMGVQILFIITLLTLTPSIILLMTSFTRIVIVLSFIRSALSLQGAPSNQIIIGLAFFMSMFVMSPTWSKIQVNAIDPYSQKQINGQQALEGASVAIKEFMLGQTRPKDMELFTRMAGVQASSSGEIPLNIVIPAFVISELKTAFQIGFLLFVPFIMIDLIVATVLMSMGMMMMPPVTVSLPLKILLFVLVDGWNLIVTSLLQSFAT